MNKLSHIARYSAWTVLLLMLLALAPAMAQITIVHVGETTVLEVDSLVGDTYSWELYSDSTVNFAVTNGTAVAEGAARFVNGDNIGKTAQVEWLKPGLYFFKITAYDITGCTNNLKMGIVRVLESLPTATMTSAAICVGETASITVDFTGTAPWSFTYTDGTTTKTVTDILTSPYEMEIDPNPKVTTTYTITSITDKWGTNSYPVDPKPTVIQVVNPKPDVSPIYKYEP